MGPPQMSHLVPEQLAEGPEFQHGAPEGPGREPRRHAGPQAPRGWHRPPAQQRLCVPREALQQQQQPVPMGKHGLEQGSRECHPSHHPDKAAVMQEGGTDAPGAPRAWITSWSCHLQEAVIKLPSKIWGTHAAANPDFKGQELSGNGSCFKPELYLFHPDCKRGFDLPGLSIQLCPSVSKVLGGTFNKPVPSAPPQLLGGTCMSLLLYGQFVLGALSRERSWILKLSKT